MIFHKDGLLVLIALLPLLFLFYYLSERKRRKQMKEFGTPRLLQGLSDYQSGRRRVRVFLLFAGSLFLILAAARPQFGTKSIMITGKGVDVMVAIDTSKSMYAEDVKPNRFEKARFEVDALIDRLRGNSIGLIAFSGQAFPECPMTVDYGALRMILNSLSVGMIPVPGTAVEEAITIGVESLLKGRARSKALILITDGEDHDGDPVAAAQEAAAQGIVVFTVGIGNTKGVPLPLKDKQGNPKGYKTDSQGNTIISRLNPDILQEIALRGGGGYFPGTDGISAVASEIEKMEKSDIGSRKMTLYEERYQFLVALALLFLTVELLWSERKKNWVPGK